MDDQGSFEALCIDKYDKSSDMHLTKHHIQKKFGYFYYKCTSFKFCRDQEYFIG